jgi:hypothetical protein
MAGKKTTARTRALQLNLEGLIKLIGGTADERLRFWEILKGITTPAENKMLAQQVQSLQNRVNQVTAEVKVLATTARSMK